MTNLNGLSVFRSRSLLLFLSIPSTTSESLTISSSHALYCALPVRSEGLHRPNPNPNRDLHLLLFPKPDSFIVQADPEANPFTATAAACRHIQLKPTPQSPLTSASQSPFQGSCSFSEYFTLIENTFRGFTVLIPGIRGSSTLAALDEMPSPGTRNVKSRDI
jgi:hypothetical protein